jgi:hypothetical protein
MSLSAISRQQLSLAHLHEGPLAVCDHAVQLPIAHAVLLRNNPPHVTLQDTAASQASSTSSFAHPPSPNQLPVHKTYQPAAF